MAGERIRDKIAASKKKGMWMGGLPPLGYDVCDRKLVVNEYEAQTVLGIFRRYVELRSVRALKAELDADGIRSKHRTFADGTVYGGHTLSRGALYLMLQNRIYRGDITHKGSAYTGGQGPLGQGPDNSRREPSLPDHWSGCQVSESPRRIGFRRKR
jgi:site-specific DNA recombinase